MAVVKGFQRKELIKFGHPVMKLPDKKIYLTNSFTNSCENSSPFVSENAIAKQYYNTKVFYNILIDPFTFIGFDPIYIYWIDRIYIYWFDQIHIY